jgi:hypothetical protein
MEHTSQQGLVGGSVLGFASKTGDELWEESECYYALREWERAKWAELKRETPHKRFRKLWAGPHSMETRSKKALRALLAAIAHTTISKS